jgi:hypothetical protein
MNIITHKESVGSDRGYIWYDDTKPSNGYKFKWSLTYDMIPEPKMFSDEYIEKYPEDFDKPGIIERVLIILKLKQDDPRKRKYKYD